MAFRYSVSPVCNLVASTTTTECRLKLEKEILVYMTNLEEYKAGKTYLFIEDDKMQIQALRSDRPAFLR